MKKSIVSLLALLLIAVSSIAQTYVPAPENLEARTRFQDNKFGIFLHFGLYSMMADGEWVMNNKDLNRDEYRMLAGAFYPSKFNADEWVAAIKASGAKYICFTTRHHEGFSLFHTAYSPYNVVDATPFGRDIVKELSDACHRQGIDIHFYYSHLDWDRDDYPTTGRTGQKNGRTRTSGDWPAYYTFMNNQLTELLTNYGEVGAIWFDGVWDRASEDWQLEEQYALIHSLRPACLIGNNHHATPVEGEDFQMFERDLPGENVVGYSEGVAISRLPLETCQTMNGVWGYRMTDQNYKSTRDLIHYLVKAAGMNANLLLNLGPQPDGRLPEMGIQRMKEMGEWMSQYGETIYGTRGGEVAPHSWGVSTRKDNSLYIHILNLNDKALFVPLPDGMKIASARLFIDKTKVAFSRVKGGILLQFSEVPAAIDTVIELSIRK